MKWLLPITWPLSKLYTLILVLRNALYSIGILNQTEFDIPTINVGNLALGGTGKTPHIEYLIRLLRTNNAVAVLSRGYMRRTKGYFFAKPDVRVEEIGDEPMQIYKRFQGEVPVAVCENRVLGIPDLLMDAPQTDIVLLDDAYQHRAIKPGLNILLTDFHRLYCDDYVLPAGYLREYASASIRADLIIVTKCPPNLSQIEAEKIRNKLNPKANQSVFFSYLHYGDLYSMHTSDAISQNQLQEYTITLFCGIARPERLVTHLSQLASRLDFIAFPDHHRYQINHIDLIKKRFEAIRSEKSILVCTEKDAVKIRALEAADEFHTLPIYIQPVDIAFFEWNKEQFNEAIYAYLRTSTAVH